LKGHAGDLLKVDRRGRSPEYVERPCLTIGLTVQPEVLRGLADRPGFRGRGLLARFLYALPASLVGHRQPGAPPVSDAVAHCYTLELQSLAASLTTATGDEPTLLTLDAPAGELLLEFESDWNPGWPPVPGIWRTWPAGPPSSSAPAAASPPCCTWQPTCATAGPAPSAPTPSPARSGWPAT
jgi:replicative DNA helicase